MCSFRDQYWCDEWSLQTTSQRKNVFQAWASLNNGHWTIKNEASEIDGEWISSECLQNSQSCLCQEEVLGLDKGYKNNVHLPDLLPSTASLHKQCCANFFAKLCTGKLKGQLRNSINSSPELDFSGKGILTLGRRIFEKRKLWSWKRNHGSGTVWCEV